MNGGEKMTDQNTEIPPVYARVYIRGVFGTVVAIDIPDDDRPELWIDTHCIQFQPDDEDASAYWVRLGQIKTEAEGITDQAEIEAKNDEDQRNRRIWRNER